uniref:Cathepsin propeptide inhibitor domain-containing protein n=1 Tax=Oncorhynchus mykiss TaxID=8022 RepID=A0A8C7P4P1_ONCMY
IERTCAFADKTYESHQEGASRKLIWLAKWKMVMEHSKRAEKGLETYTMGLNYFSDLIWYHLVCFKHWQQRTGRKDDQRFGGDQ